MPTYRVQVAEHVFTLLVEADSEAEAVAVALEGNAIEVVNREEQRVLAIQRLPDAE